MLKLWELSRN